MNTQQQRAEQQATFRKAFMEAAFKKMGREAFLECLTEARELTEKRHGDVGELSLYEHVNALLPGRRW